MVLLGWENPLGWLAFLSLIPFLLLYFVRPKPQELEVPSLMFFMKSQYTDKERSFLKRFRSDWLFWLQLLTLLLLSLFFLDPFTSLGGNVLVDHAVFVLDISASMQVDNRFADAVAFAEDHLARSNTFILVSNTPRVGAEDLSESDAERFLNNLKVTAGRSNIGDAMLLAGQYIKNEESKAHIISDFISTEGIGIEAAKNALKARGIAPELHSVRKEKEDHDNIGIIDVRVDEAATTVYFKNYNRREEKITFTVDAEEKTLTLKPLFIEPYSFKTRVGATKITLQRNDDFAADNTAWTSVPASKRISVLLLTDAPSKYLQAALESSGKVDVIAAPTSRAVPKDYDVYVFHDVDGRLSSAVVATLTAAVKEGKGLIIYAEPDSLTHDYGSLLPVTLTTLETDAVVEVAQSTKLTSDILFGDVQHHFGTKQEQGITLATANNHSVLSLLSFGAGKILYYGILEGESDFPLQPSYPIFWTNAVRFLAQQGDIDDFTLESGLIFSLPSKQNVKTPSKKIATSTILFDELGLYTIGDDVFAANLADELESDIDAVAVKQGVQPPALGQLAAEEKKYPLEKLLLLIAGALLLLEVVVMRLRGEV